MAFVVRLLVAAALAASVGAGGAAAESLNQFKAAYFYGDSLVDDGNTYRATDETFPPSPPYYEGRFSNGPVWPEYIADDFEKRGQPTNNFAYGGANALPNNGQVPGVPWLGLQIAKSVPQLLATHDLNSVAMVLIGSNDINEAASAGGDTEAVGAAAAAAVVGGALALYGLGVEHVQFFTLPPIALTPRYTMAEPALAAQVARGAAAFNTTLLGLLPALSALDLSYSTFDLDALFRDAIANPAAYGFTNVTDSCLFTGCTTPGSYLFWDELHPTAAAHQQIAALVAAELATAPLPVPAALLLLGMVVLGAARLHGARRA